MSRKYIDVNNTSIKIHPYEMGEYPSLEKSLSLFDKLTFSLTTAYHYNEDNKVLTIPRGISIAKLESTFGVYANINKISDSYTRSIVKLNSPPRDEKQMEAIDFLLSNGNYKNLSSHSRLLLELDTGVGKTYCTIAAMCAMKIKGAVILNSLDLINQWKDRIMEYSNIVEGEIFIVKGLPTIKKILNGKTEKHKVYLISHATIRSYASSNGWEAVTDVFQKMNIGIKVYDEAHKELINTIFIDMFTNTKKTIYLTATAGRSDVFENKLYGRIYGSVPSLSIKRKKEEAYLTSIIIKYDSKPNIMDRQNMVSMKGLNSNLYLEYEVFGKGRLLFYRSIFTILETIKTKEDGQIAILAGRKNAVKDIIGFIEKNFPEYRGDIGEFTSDIKGAEKEKQKSKKIIVTTFKSFGTGMDLKKLRYLIMCEPYSSKITLHQTTGRLRDIGGNLYYFELVDIGIPSRLKQFNSIKNNLLSVSKHCKEFTIQ